MNKFKNFLDNFKKLDLKNLQNFSLICFIILGLSIVKDYSISYDEQEYRQQGFIVLNHLGQKFIPEKVKEISETRALNFRDINEYYGDSSNTFKFHHSAFALVEYLFLKDAEKKNVYLLRHYINFIMACFALIMLYKFLRLSFDRTISTIGTISLVLHPRIFSNFFYNPNDIWSLFFILCSVYFLFKIIKTDKFLYFFLFSIFLALAINIRFINIYIYPIFIIFYLYNKNFYKIDYKKLSIQLFLMISLLIIISPELWDNPLNFFNKLFGQINHVNIIDRFSEGASKRLMFNGNLIGAHTLPWYYLFLWIIITTPLIIIFFSFAGILFFFKNLFNNFKFMKEDRLLIDGLVIFLLFTIPLISYLIFRPEIFNGWRHFYFLYVFLIYFFCYSLFQIKNSNIKKFKKNIIFILLIMNFTMISYWIVKNHPYQNVFFNSFSKKYAKGFELDYWGLTNLEALKNIIKNETTFPVYISHFHDRSRIDFSLHMLNKEDKKKIKLEKDWRDKKVKYIITNINNAFTDKHYDSLGLETYNVIKIDDLIINRILVKK